MTGSTAKSTSRFSSTFCGNYPDFIHTAILDSALFVTYRRPCWGLRAFGLISIARAVFTGFCETVLTEAATDALISLPVIEELHFATMTTVNLAFATVISASILAFAVPIAHLFKDAELTAVLRWMAVLPLISALASAPNACTKRALQFRPLAVRAITGISAGGAVGLKAGAARKGRLGIGVAGVIVQRAVSVVTSLVGRTSETSHRHIVAAPERSEGLLRTSVSFAHDEVGFEPSSPFSSRPLPGRCRSGFVQPRFTLRNDILTQVTVVPKYAVMWLEFRQFPANPIGLEESLRDVLRQMSLMYFPLHRRRSGGHAGAFLRLARFALVRGHRARTVLMLLMGLPAVSLFAIGAVLMALNFQRTEALALPSPTR